MKTDDTAHVVAMVSNRLMRFKKLNPGPLPDGTIEELVDVELGSDSYEVERESVIAVLERKFDTQIGVSTSLHSSDMRDRPDAPWVAGRVSDSSLEWEYWSRYRQYLLQQGFEAPVVSRLDETTNGLLDSMMPPDMVGPWDQRGLVVGYVQSGKTANYTALICKAVDAGYKVIIILAGAHNSLRTQTQIRLEEGFLGYRTIDEDVNKRESIGAGLLMPVEKLTQTITARGDNGDFKTAVARNYSSNPGGEPLLFVVKKNTTILKNLHNWIEGAASIQGGSQIVKAPLLMIDDESDYASVDTKRQSYDDGDPDPEHDPTKTNGWIRKILKSFSQSVYIGYTATPFANIFIPETGKSNAYDNDLFPRSFIFNLPLSSNYTGPVKMFGLNDEQGDGYPVFRKVKDHAESLSLFEKEGWMPPRIQKTHVPRYHGEGKVPPSLREAICCFILSTAARRAREQESAHNSMLVHVTRFVAVQNHVKEQVEKELYEIRDRVIYGDGDRESVMTELRDLWERDYVPTTEQIDADDCEQLSWNQVESRIREVVLSITVKAINGSSSDVFEYARRKETGQAYDVIAIGGDKLSRGLTLEGLTVSYFLRPSRTYDTLMQMGRWFGYRPGYVDMCRIYTTNTLIGWFRHISVAGEELREDFNRMAVSGSTPREFGHRVLNHPQMMVTSPSKMRHTERRTTSYDGFPVETILFPRTLNIVENNYESLTRLVADLIRDTQAGKCERDSKKKLLWRRVSSDRVVDFLNTYRGYPGAIKARPDYVRKYIENQNHRGMLTDWTVYVASGELGPSDLVAGVDNRLVKRAWFQQPDPAEISNADPYRVRRVGDPTHEYLDLTPEETEQAKDTTIRMWEASPADKRRGDRPKIPRGPGIRQARPPQRGLIVLYPIKAEIPAGIAELPCPLVGFLISFPGDRNAVPIYYTVNEVYKRQEEAGFLDE